MARKTRPYLFYDTTTSVCGECLHVVEAKIVMRGERVYMDKWCPAHGTERVLVSDDAAYYRACRETWIKPPELPMRFATTMQYGCPYDCGLCPDHVQHSCLSLVEINEHCNLECPICYADSGPKRSLHRSLDEVERCSTRSSQAKASPTSCRSRAASRRCIRSSSRSWPRPRRGPSAT